MGHTNFDIVIIVTIYKQARLLVISIWIERQLRFYHIIPGWRPLHEQICGTVAIAIEIAIHNDRELSIRSRMAGCILAQPRPLCTQGTIKFVGERRQVAPWSWWRLLGGHMMAQVRGLHIVEIGL